MVRSPPPGSASVGHASKSRTILRRVIVCLVAGAVVSLISAWLDAALDRDQPVPSPPMESSRAYFNDLDRTILRTSSRRWGRHQYSCGCFPKDVPGWQLDELKSIPGWVVSDEQCCGQTATPRWVQVDDARGWPVPCMRFGVVATYPNDDSIFADAFVVHGGVRIPGGDESWLGMPAALPLRPMWWPLLLDAAIWGTVTWCLVWLFSWRLRQPGFVRASGLRWRRASGRASVPATQTPVTITEVMPHASGHVGRQQWLRFRNQVIRILESHGTVTGMGVFPIGSPNAEEEWSAYDTDDGDFMVHDNRQSKAPVIDIEILHGQALDQAWLDEVVNLLRYHKGWAVTVGPFASAYLWITSSGLTAYVEPDGLTFRRCSTLADVIAAGRDAHVDQITVEWEALRDAVTSIIDEGVSVIIQFEDGTQQSHSDGLRRVRREMLHGHSLAWRVDRLGTEATVVVTEVVAE